MPPKDPKKDILLLTAHVRLKLQIFLHSKETFNEKLKKKHEIT